MSKQPLIACENVHFAYPGQEREIGAVRGVSLALYEGEMVCLIGHNGSGKSTLARLIGALLQPAEGAIRVAGLDTADAANEIAIRRQCGLVFQNPDNQIVATIVEEDVAFGPENLGIEPAEIRKRVDEALAAVGMEKHALDAPHFLSGGQKQRIAIAGLLAMQPRMLVLDEPTAMLDPVGRREVLATVKKLREEHGVSVLWITHFMEEAAQFDRVLVMDDGVLVAQGVPDEVFAQATLLRGIGLDVPRLEALRLNLAELGVHLPAGLQTPEKMAEALCPSL